MIFSGSARKRNAGNRNPQRQHNRKSCQRVGGVHQGHAAVVLDPDEESCLLVHFTGGDLRGIFYIWNGHIPTETYPEPVWHIRCLGGNSQRYDTNLARPFPLRLYLWFRKWPNSYDWFNLFTIIHTFIDNNEE